jgi:hypothetical protein
MVFCLYLCNCLFYSTSNNLIWHLIRLITGPCMFSNSVILVGDLNKGIGTVYPGYPDPWAIFKLCIVNNVSPLFKYMMCRPSIPTHLFCQSHVLVFTRCLSLRVRKKKEKANQSATRVSLERVDHPRKYLLYIMHELLIFLLFF